MLKAFKMLQIQGRAKCNQTPGEDGGGYNAAQTFVSEWGDFRKSMAEMSNVYTFLIRKSEGKILLWRPSSTWKDNIKTYHNTWDIKM